MLVLYAASLIIFGLLFDTPLDIIKGFFRIIIEPDLLITDYIGVGGIGASFVNSGVLTIACIYLLYKLKIDINGSSIASIFVVSGFALFGKNLFNVWFIILGVYLYARIQNEKFSKYIYVALFGTSLAPMVTQMVFGIERILFLRIIFGIIVGIMIGIILPPLSVYLMRVHQGFNLYNIGFTAGIIGTIFVSIFKSFGFMPEKRMIWSAGNNFYLGIYLFILFLSMIFTGYYLNDKSFLKLRNIFSYQGRLVTDFVMLEGFGVTLINMGISGLTATAYILLVNGDLNGPTIGGIFTIVGFSALGKHTKTVIPIFLGVFLGSLIKVWSINDPAILLAALFGTTLAPISGEFGWIFGILAGFIHSSVVLNVGVLHGSLNLYNNGFSGGIVASVLVPIIEAFRKDEY